MGSVSNVGLMAQKAEEYGSHNTTFEMKTDGTVIVQSSKGTRFFAQKVEKGDIWRLCQVKDAPVSDWVKMALSRAKTVGCAVFWLDKNRAHDAEIIKKVNQYLGDQNTEGLDLRILAPERMRFTLERVRAGLDAVRSLVIFLRLLDRSGYIFELGTSAKCSPSYR